MTNPIRDLPHYLKIFQIYLGRRMYYVFALAMVAGLAEGVGILMFLPLLQSLDSGASNSGNGEVPVPIEGISTHIHNFLSLMNMQDSTVGVLLIITLAFIVKGALTFWVLGYSAYLRGQLLRELKGKLFDRYSNMTYSYYSSRDTGHFINLINEQITKALLSFANFAKLGAQLISAMVYLVLAFVVAWRLGIMALVVGVFLLILFRKLNHFVRELSRKTASENGHPLTAMESEVRAVSPR
ncbi:ABC transporter transmembrane domain-containing protein [Candidatus Reidiella endopervernicosa]|nr:ABC transporter transmembrane domain-containing protein [Candidatus Reidiella endopervernicosa]